MINWEEYERRKKEYLEKYGWNAGWEGFIKEITKELGI